MSCGFSRSEDHATGSCICQIVSFSNSEGYSSCMCACVLLFLTVRAVHNTAHVCVCCSFETMGDVQLMYVCVMCCGFLTVKLQMYSLCMCVCYSFQTEKNAQFLYVLWCSEFKVEMHSSCIGFQTVWAVQLVCGGFQTVKEDGFQAVWDVQLVYVYVVVFRQ